MAGTARGPARDLEQMCREAPRRVRLEHAVLEHEVARICPVVRYVALRMVTEDVHRVVVAAHRDRVAMLRRVLRVSQETVHLAAVNGCSDVHLAVRATYDDVAVINVRAYTAAGRARQTRVRHTVGHRDPVRAGERAEVM